MQLAQLTLIDTVKAIRQLTDGFYSEAPHNDVKCSYYTMITLMTVVSPRVFKMM
jgi:hypothetical protein